MLRKNLDTEEIIERFKSGDSVKAIAEHFKVGRPAIVRRLKEAGLKPRNRSEGMYARMARTTPEERKRLASAAHKAIRENGITHGQARTRMYRIYKGIKARCYNPNRKCYFRYGGRGIAMCDEWRTSYSTFKKWSQQNGYDEHLTIDRIDSNGNYEPSNCRWITASQNSKFRNFETAKKYEYMGEAKRVTEWANDERCQVGRDTLKSRLRHGWDFVKAITTPPYSSS